MLRIEVEQEDDGRWLAEIPALPGVMAYGATRDDAQSKVEALAWQERARAALGAALGFLDTPRVDPLPREAEAPVDRGAYVRHKIVLRTSAHSELPLYLLLPYDLSAVAQQICCHQEIAADSCFALGMLAQYEIAAAEPWRYRTLYWECGMLGQVLYLEADAEGARGTLICRSYHEPVHDVLGLTGGA